MTEKYRFFNGTEEDVREYQASEYADYFATLVTNGVWAEEFDSLEVTGHGGEMKTIIAPGKAFINGYYYENDANLELQHDAAHATLPRIDRVVLRLDVSLGSRFLKAFVLKGTPNESPAAPAVTREGQVWELSLARVLIPAGQSYIETSNVTDERSNETYGGYSRYKLINNWYPGSVVSKTASYTVELPVQTVLCAPSTSNATITLPSAADNHGREIRVKKTNAPGYSVIVNSVSGNIDGSASFLIYDLYESYVFVSDGSNWYVF